MISNLRMASYKFLPRTLALKDARVAYGRYKCASCMQVHPKRDIQLDHVVPVVDPLQGVPRLNNGEFDYNTYIKRLFVPKVGWQVLCKSCHQKKTNDENKKRRR